MLDEIKQNHKMIWELLDKELNNNKLSHAYLFYGGSSNSLKLETAIEFVKKILCENQIDGESCNNCYIYNNINNNTFSKIKIIDSSDFQIKKEEILELKKDFNKKAVEAKKRIYIINNCDKLNSYSANTILKFLEEPEEDIIAILITDNLYKVLNTISSRCQKIKFNELSTINLIQTKDFDEIQIEAVVSFIESYKKNGKKIISDINVLWFDFFKTKEENELAFEIMLFFYEDILKYYYFNKIIHFPKYTEKIKQIIDNFDIKKIESKIKQILFLKQKIKQNLNLNLILDRFVLEEGGY